QLEPWPRGNGSRGQCDRRRRLCPGSNRAGLRPRLKRKQTDLRTEPRSDSPLAARAGVPKRLSLACGPTEQRTEDVGACLGFQFRTGALRTATGAPPGGRDLEILAGTMGGWFRSKESARGQAPVTFD